jgi:HAD superfamily hydrolase (TIGR01549 family)
VPFDTVSLDAGGVLVWPNWVRVSDALRANGIDVDPGVLAAADAPVRRSLDEPALIATLSDQRRSWDFFNRVLMRSGVTLSTATEAALTVLREYQRTSNIWEHVPAFVVPALVELRRRGFKLVVVSNANGTVRRTFNRLGLDILVDEIIDSAEEGIEKPDRRLFEVALARIGSRPERTLHAGDFYHIDVVGARSAGMTPVLVDESDLYGDFDCARIRSIAELPAVLEQI